MNKTTRVVLTACSAAALFLTLAALQQNPIVLDAGKTGYTLVFSGTKNRLPSSFPSGTYLSALTDAGSDFFICASTSNVTQDESVFFTFGSTTSDAYICSQAPFPGGVCSIKGLLSIEITCSGLSAEQGIFLSLFSDSEHYALPSANSASQLYTTTITTNDLVTLGDAQFGALPENTFFCVGLPSNNSTYTASIVSLIFTYSC